MHLAFLTSEYPHPRTTPAAGIGSSIRNMATALAKRGTKISIFIYGQQQDEIFSEEGIKFHLIKQREYKLLGWYLHRKFLQHYLNKYIAVEGIDAVEVPDWTGISAFMKLKCPLVIRFHGSDAYFCNLEGRPQKKKNFWFEKTALHAADHLLSVSEFTANETKRIFNLKKKITVIPNAINVQRFLPLPEKVQQGNILYFGSLVRKKGVLELPAIFNALIRKMPQLQLRIAGRDVTDISTGRSTKELMQEQLPPQAAIQVEWLGSLSYDDILEEINRAQLVVLPSFAEALPMTWIEAMAMEKALVTSNIGWAKEVMVDGETGFTVDPKDHKTNAEKILQLLNDPELAEKMGKAARQRVLEKFSTEVVVERNVKFYEGVVKREKRKVERGK